MKAIIVEDNPGALKELKSFLNKDHPGIEICGDSGSVIEAAKLIRKEQILAAMVKVRDAHGWSE
jgi:DNA-binding NarL/FixJ family response regulator